MTRKIKFKKQGNILAFQSKLLPTLGRSIFVLGLLTGASNLLTAPAQALQFLPIGTYSTGIFDDAAAQIPAYDPSTGKVFVTNASTNQIDVFNISDPTKPQPLTPINFPDYDLSVGTVNSVAFQNGILAAAVENVDPQKNGSVLFFNSDQKFLGSVEVGAGPDMLTFTADGKFILTANEGEPSNDYLNDPEGSVSIISINNSNDITTFGVTTAGFKGVPIDESVRIFGPGASVEQDLEPEYIAVSPDLSQAWVTLQENNAIALLNLNTGAFERVFGLGYKDHSQPENALDTSNDDDAINITTYDNLFGMYQPDGIRVYNHEGKTFLVTANEGDARQYDAFDEEITVGAKDEEGNYILTLDPLAFPDAANLQKEDQLGNLIVTTTMGDTDGDGDFDELYAFGGRSFSIWEYTGEELKLAFDSGSMFEKITADLYPDFFNSNNTANNFDNRSDNKGPEPEGLTLIASGGKTFACIGLERIGGVMCYDITDPYNPVYSSYVNNRNFLGNPEDGTALDLGPEELLYINAQNSPNGKPLLLVTNEVSGTTTVYEAVPEPSIILGAITGGAFLFGNKYRKKKRKKIS